MTNAVGLLFMRRGEQDRDGLTAIDTSEQISAL